MLRGNTIDVQSQDLRWGRTNQKSKRSNMKERGSRWSNG